MFRKVLLWMVKTIIRKHFAEGLSPIYGSGYSKNIPIAWRWTFEDEKWGKFKIRGAEPMSKDKQFFSTECSSEAKKTPHGCYEYLISRMASKGMPSDDLSVIEALYNFTKKQTPKKKVKCRNFITDEMIKSADEGVKNETTIKVYEIVNGDAAISSDDGETLFKHIVKVFENSDKIIIDFSGINIITATFLNSGIGQLYGEYDWRDIKQKISVENASYENKDYIQRIVNNAKSYFKQVN